MKKLFFIILVFIISLGFIACKTENEPTNNNENEVELSGVKDDAINELNEFIKGFKAEDYTEANWSLITNTLESAKTAINAANNTEIVENTIKKAKETIESISKIEVKYFIVIFDVDGVKTTAEVAEGGKAEKPVTPVKEGCTFLGWYIEDALYDFESTVTANITLVAAFEEVKEPTPEPVKYVVTFDVDGKLTTAEVKEGEKAEKPATPVKDGFKFLGWYVGDEEYDFETAIISDITLTAMFAEIKYVVTFDVDGKLTTVEVKYNEKVSKPADPVKEGYSFLGWYVGEQELSTQFDFETIVTSDMTLVAKFEEIDLDILNQENAIKEITRYYGFYDKIEYSDENWALIEEYYNECVEKIKNTTNKDEMDAAVAEAKSLIVVVLTIYEEEDARLLAKIEEGKAKVQALFDKYPQSEFEYANYYVFKVTYEEAIHQLDNVGDESEIDAIVEKALASMNDVPRLLKLTYVGVEDSTWGYVSILQMREELLADYNKFNGSSYTLETIPTELFQHINYDAFYLSEGMQEKWKFLVEFFSDNAKTSNNRNAYTLLLTSKDYDSYKTNPSYSGENTPYAISYEFKAFLSFTIVRPGHTIYGTNDYTDEKLCEKIWNYAKPIDTYEKGDSYVFPAPFRKYQQFLGWYDNPEFTGEAITEILPTDNESMTLYAKWSELSTDDVFAIYKDSKVEELKSYIESTKDQSKYNESAWNELLSKYESAINNILSQTTEELVDKAFNDGKDSIDSVKETIFTVSYELNGGHWYFSNKTELTAKLLADYSKMKGETITADSFFERSYGSITTFFKTFPEWLWLLDFLKDNCLDGKESQFNIETGLTEAQVRAEIAGFMLNTSANYAGYVSADYSDESKFNDFIAYATTKSFNYLEATNSLMTPLKDGFVFVGWYDNPQFNGDVVTSADATIILYAKWEVLK